MQTGGCLARGGHLSVCALPDRYWRLSGLCSPSTVRAQCYQPRLKKQGRGSPLMENLRILVPLGVLAQSASYVCVPTAGGLPGLGTVSSRRVPELLHGLGLCPHQQPYSQALQLGHHAPQGRHSKARLHPGTISGDSQVVSSIWAQPNCGR